MMTTGNGPDSADAPLTARSVLASALLGTEPPELPVAQLVHLAGLFGINENRARVALFRMVQAGEASTDGAGRYRLAGRLAERQSRQQASRAARTAPWRGEWHEVVVTTVGSPAPARGARRGALEFARLAELRDGVWLRPANLALDLPDAVQGDVVVLTARHDEPADLAARLWDLDGWAGRAGHLLERLGAHPTAGPADLASGFVLSASVLRHLQADPLLPEDLWPAGWPGPTLRARYDRWDAEYRAVLSRWSRRDGDAR
jgi:phenylacetic acid degradation operon negative regulatory protein